MKKSLEAYLIGFVNEDPHPEVIRFIKDLLIKIEFGHFEDDEEEDYEEG